MSTGEQQEIFDRQKTLLIAIASLFALDLDIKRERNKRKNRKLGPVGWHTTLYDAFMECLDFAGEVQNGDEILHACGLLRQVLDKYLECTDDTQKVQRAIFLVELIQGNRPIKITDIESFLETS